ncbi:ABC transporter permease [Ichthyobacterium seriolicida]|uniref:ABC-2 type transporter transmembrane domain-containing protein n=1 Tax=Ichthyobacterium seriolicida TaxID=242600 RepID=A0A1J1DXA1_9FLAO|nr:ABC transporter permease [Ichthyobacterium seriolicida]BAV94479.1 hypothetical protein JBKA6_0466 [Ichthyobacterium seriolicida]
MNKAIRKLFLIQLLSSIRSPESIFYSVIFPPTLFIIFGFSFGVGQGYINFFLSGMIGVTIIGDGLNAIGPVIKLYYSLGIVKYFKSYPLNIIWLFISFILVRMMVVLFSCLILILLSYLFFELSINQMNLTNYIIGGALLFIIYSFLGLLISLYGIDSDKSTLISSFVFFGSMFLSDAYFNISSVNTVFLFISYIFPLKVVLNFMRGNDIHLLWSILWLILVSISFYLVITNTKLKRIQ